MDNLMAELSGEVWPLISTIIYSVLGMILLGLAILIMEKIAPFSIRKEIEEDQNTSLAVLMGSMFIAIAIVIGAVILSGSSGSDGPNIQVVPAQEVTATAPPADDE